mgnify:CR=1 FL=1
MFKKMMKFTAIRLVAIPLGFVLYIYTMIKDPGSMRTAQKFARSLSDWIEALLPDQYAVLVPTLNLESSLLLMSFTVIAFMVAEIMIACLRVSLRPFKKK